MRTLNCKYSRMEKLRLDAVKCSNYESKGRSIQNACFSVSLRTFSLSLQEDALKAAKEVDPVAQQIGAVNTLIRQPDGSFKVRMAMHLLAAWIAEGARLDARLVHASVFCSTLLIMNPC